MGSETDAKVEKLVDIYANHVLGISADAGWHAPSQLECLRDASIKSVGGRKKAVTAAFSSGDERSANDSADTKMINETFYLRNAHHDFALAKLIIGKLKEKQQAVLLAEPRMRIAYKRKFKDSELAEYLGMPIATYRKTLSRARDAVRAIYIFTEEVKKATK